MCKIETSAKVASRFWHVMGTFPCSPCEGQRAGGAGGGARAQMMYKPNTAYTSTHACVTHSCWSCVLHCYYCSRVPLSFVLYLNIGITILSYKKYTQCGCRLIHSKTGATRSRSISRHVVFVAAHVMNASATSMRQNRDFGKSGKSFLACNGHVPPAPLRGAARCARWAFGRRCAPLLGRCAPHLGAARPDPTNMEKSPVFR